MVFLTLFYSLEELLEVDLSSAEVEGVAEATETAEKDQIAREGQHCLHCSIICGHKK